MRYKTKPIDYTGCHPTIAEALQNNKAIYCKLWDYTEEAFDTLYVTGYDPSESHPYLAGRVGWEHAEPVPIVTRVKKASEIIKWCEDHGWRFTTEGIIEPRYYSGEDKLYLIMLSDCGKLLTDAQYAWTEPEWLEEVEE